MIDIATLAKQTGIPAHTLRYYETRGLIAPVSRSGLKRVFADDVVLKLQLIQLGQQVGMSLDDINLAFGLNADMAVKRSALAQQAATVATQIRQLQTIQTLLQHLLACPHEQHLDCPEFLALLQTGLPVSDTQQKP